MTTIRAALLAATLLAASAGQAAALDGVVASIKPIHSLVAAVMEGVGDPSLIVSGAGSPHTYSMRPSQAEMLENAGLVFWVGHDLELFLDGALDTLAGDATVVELGEAEGLTKLAYREGGPFESHAQEEAGDSEHDVAADHDHGSEAGQDHGATDMHFWLDPENAKIMLREIETALSAADPENAQAYAANAAATAERIDALIADTRDELAAIDNRRFVVFHDAYQYYENRFDFPAAGSVTVSPDVMPGAQRLSEIQDRVRQIGAACVFAEPQFEPRLIDVVIEGTDARAGVLDPLGSDLEDGPGLYFELIGNLTASLSECLQPEG